MAIRLIQMYGQLHFDGSRHWVRLSDRFHRYNPTKQLPDENYLTINDVEIIAGKVDLERLPTEKAINSPEEIKTDTSKIAPQDRTKPEKYITPDEQLLAALEGGS